MQSGKGRELPEAEGRPRLSLEAVGVSRVVEMDVVVSKTLG